MQESVDTNKARTKLLAGTDLKSNGWNRVFEVTEGDHMLWHVTNCLTSCANGHLLPSVLVHSRPGPKAAALRLTSTEASGILAADGTNPSGIGVLVTRNGSMERGVFGEWARHFVKQLGRGLWAAYGKGKLGVLLFFDGHTSRWSYEVWATPTPTHHYAQSRGIENRADDPQRSKSQKK